ncbi:nuclear transport factor 2 family protein, partial [Mariniluteicoccus endophyticus]
PHPRPLPGRGQRPRYTTIGDSTQHLEQSSVRVLGDTALVTGVVCDRLDSGEEFRMLGTMTWVRDADGWRLIAGHAGPRL